MIYQDACPPDTPLVPVTYALLEPARMVVRLANGAVVIRGYGVGEQLHVMKPSLIYPTAGRDKVAEIPLADGSVIIDWSPDDLRYAMVWPA